MNGWRLAAVIVLAFGGGWTLASWYALIRNEETQVRLYRRALIAEANTDHTLCKVTDRRQKDLIAYQERELDTYRAGKDVGDEAEDYLRGGS